MLVLKTYCVNEKYINEKKENDRINLHKLTQRCSCLLHKDDL